MNGKVIGESDVGERGIEDMIEGRKAGDERCNVGSQ